MGRFYNPFAIGEGGQCLLWVIRVGRSRAVPLPARFDWKVSILWIEHDLQLVTDLADRVHVLNIGECIASGTPEEVKRVPAVISAHVGDEPIAQPWRRASSSDDGPTSDGWGSGANIAGGLPQSHYFAGEAGPLDDVRYGSASPPTPAVLLPCRELT